VGRPFFGRLGFLASRLFPTTVLGSLEAKLVQAGEPTTVAAFVAVQAVAIALALAIAILGLSSASGMGLLFLVVATVAIAGLPLYWLRARVKARKTAILKALPDALDLIVTTVEAGLGIDAALAEVGHETTGPLGEELRLTVRETTLGRSRRDALLRLIDRTQVPELKSFVQSIIQAEQAGVPIGQVLRTQAEQMRLRKRQWAEAEAQRAPIKMIVILVFFILPSMMLMIMGPAVMRITDSDVF
jgi:tight adherence protein C